MLVTVRGFNVIIVCEADLYICLLVMLIVMWPCRSSQLRPKLPVLTWINVQTSIALFPWRWHSGAATQQAGHYCDISWYTGTLARSALQTLHWAMYHRISRCMLCTIHSIFANAPRVSLQSDLQMLDGEFVNEEKLPRRKWAPAPAAWLLELQTKVHPKARNNGEGPTFKTLC